MGGTYAKGEGKVLWQMGMDERRWKDKRGRESHEKVFQPRKKK
jgi:hypothetical protein